MSQNLADEKTRELREEMPVHWKELYVSWNERRQTYEYTVYLDVSCCYEGNSVHPLLRLDFEAEVDTENTRELMKMQIKKDLDSGYDKFQRREDAVHA